MKPYSINIWTLSFLLNVMLPISLAAQSGSEAARSTTGINVLPDGNKYYAYQVKYWTTTNKTPDKIYKIGIAEVKRIRDKMELIKSSVKS